MKAIDFILLPLIFLAACLTNGDRGQFYDPVWEVDLYGKKEEIMKQLLSGPGVKNYLFSLKKSFHLDYSTGKAFMNSHMDQPGFEKGQLKQLRYTLSADTKDETPLEFSVPLYEFFKDKWTDAFSVPEEELHQPGYIILKWNLKDNMTLSITVNKQFNSYLVEYQK
jgi:hypothetical protein